MSAKMITVCDEKLRRMLQADEREEMSGATTLARDELNDEEHEAFYWHGYATALRNVVSLLGIEVSP